MTWVKHSARFLLVTIGIILLTSFTIDATDALRGSQTALSIFTQDVLEDDCQAGTVRIDLRDSSLCVDKFEASPSADCVYTDVQSAENTVTNQRADSCLAVSTSEQMPWTFVNWHNAKALCAARDARLPTAEEWYEAALGTDANGCNLAGELAETGDYEACVSSRNINDMVGNVWEWVDEEAVDGQYNERDLPDEGYVLETDTAGVAVLTGNQPSDIYEEDYFWHTKTGVFAMMRGGFYGSENDGGVYAVHAEVAPSFSSAAIGFRCVKDI